MSRTFFKLFLLS